MFLPLTTDRPQRRPPVATWAILLANVALFVAVKGLAGGGGQDAQDRLLNLLSFDPVAFGLHKGPGGFEPLLMRPGISGEPLDGNSGAWWTLLTYQFAHGGFLHLLGNLLILWVFGPSVEDRLGKVGFTLFYLVGGVLAALLHGAFEVSPVIGASGAIAAVTGAFLVLFPRTHIKVLIFMVLVGVYELPAWIFIVIAVAKDVWGVGSQADGVAFLAHLGGYAYGFTVAMLLLVTRLLPQEDWTLFAIASHAKRRAEFRASAREAEAEWKRRVERRPAGADERDEAAPAKSPARGVEERVLWQRTDAQEHRTMTQAESVRLAGLRGALAAKVQEGDAAGASDALRALLREGRSAAGNRRVLMDAGTLLASAGKHAEAAEAYEAFLSAAHGTHDADADRVRLLLALVYQRYLGNSTRAARALAGIKGSFTDPELHALAESLKGELRPAG